jgi:hypothetical protein
MLFKRAEADAELARKQQQAVESLRAYLNSQQTTALRNELAAGIKRLPSMRSTRSARNAVSPSGHPPHPDGFAFTTSDTPRPLCYSRQVFLAVVQRILRHSSPTVTAAVYGHLDIEDMGAALGKLSFTPKLESRRSGAPDCRHGGFGAPVVRNREKVKSKRDVSLNGPSRIRTWDRSVMSRQL